jgi:hypothetical protein
MGKYDIKKEKKSSNLPVWIIGICVILVAVAIVVVGLLRNGTPIDPNPSTQPSQTTEPSQSTQPSQPTEPSQSTQPTQPSDPKVETEPEEGVISLAGNLTISYLGKYAGIFMEDGTDEVVSNVMMLIVRNDGTEDLQLARINLYYADYTAQFEVTNLPAGESVVLLEKNRHAFENADYIRAEAVNVVHFAEPMPMMKETFEITGGDGYLDVKNISNADISGDIFVYYKNSASDLLYGGITYRARLSGGIKAGETMRIMTGHYHEGASRLLMVTCSA